jgi:hypothetical protein
MKIRHYETTDQICAFISHEWLNKPDGGNSNRKSLTARTPYSDPSPSLPSPIIHKTRALGRLNSEFMAQARGFVSNLYSYLIYIHQKHSAYYPNPQPPE